MALVPEVSGYVLAGGRSSRMGQDKALMKLGGRPLIERAVRKLRRVCADVYILSGHKDLARYAPLVPDLNAGCGPVGGIEAAFAHSLGEWNLFLPVDMPFFPVEIMFRQPLGPECRARLFSVDGVPQPLFCLLHREVGPFVRAALERGDYKVFPVLEDAGRQLARRLGEPFEKVFSVEKSMVFAGGVPGESVVFAGDAVVLSSGQLAARDLWFANLNTPEEFTEAERHLDALDELG